MSILTEQMRTVYFVRPIGQAGPVKIGCSENPPNRLCSLMTWSPFPLEIVATVPGNLETEKRIHSAFAEQHSHREWFYPSQRLTALIAALAAGKTLDEALDYSGPIKALPKKKAVRYFSPERRMYLSYETRLRLAFRKQDGCAPQRVDEIIGRWSGYGRYGSQSAIQPTPEEIDYLDAVLKDPASHAAPRSVLYRQARAA